MEIYTTEELNRINAEKEKRLKIVKLVCFVVPIIIFIAALRNIWLPELPWNQNRARKAAEEYVKSEYGDDFITITDDEGKTYELEVLHTFDFEDKTYGVFLPTEMEPDDPDYGLIMLIVGEDEEGSFFDSIDDDEEPENEPEPPKEEPIPDMPQGIIYRGRSKKITAQPR